MRTHVYFTSSLVLTLSALPSWAAPQSSPATATAATTTTCTASSAGAGACTAAPAAGTTTASHGEKGQSSSCAGQGATAAAVTTAKGTCCAGQGAGAVAATTAEGACSAGQAAHVAMATTSKGSCAAAGQGASTVAATTAEGACSAGQAVHVAPAATAKGTCCAGEGAGTVAATTTEGACSAGQAAHVALATTTKGTCCAGEGASTVAATTPEGSCSAGQSTHVTLATTTQQGSCSAGQGATVAVTTTDKGSCCKAGTAGQVATSCQSDAKSSDTVVLGSGAGGGGGSYEVRTLTGQDGTWTIVGPDGHVVEGAAVTSGSTAFSELAPVMLEGVGWTSDGITVTDAPALPVVAQAAAQGSERGYIGIVPEIADGAMTITSVFPDSPASKAGLREGDRIVRLGGEAIGDDVMERLQKSKPGEELAIRVDRDGWSRDLTVTLAAANPSWGIPGTVPPEASSGGGGTGGLFRTITTDDDDDDADEADEADESDEADEWEEVDESDEGVSVFRFHEQLTDDLDAEEGEEAQQNPHLRVLRSGEGGHEIRVEVQGDGEGTPHVLHWNGAMADGESGEWQTDDNGHFMIKTIDIPGGKCEVQLRIEGDGQGAHALQGLHGLKNLGIEVPGFKILGDGVGQAQCCEACEHECCKEGAQDGAQVEEHTIVVEDTTVGIEDPQPRRRIALRLPEGSGGRIERNVEIPDIAGRVRRELRQSSPRVQGQAQRLRSEGGDAAETGDLRAELEDLRAQVEELRGLRSELSQIEDLRAQLHKLLKSIDSKSLEGGRTR